MHKERALEHAGETEESRFGTRVVALSVCVRVHVSVRVRVLLASLLLADGPIQGYVKTHTSLKHKVIPVFITATSFAQHTNCFALLRMIMMDRWLSLIYGNLLYRREKRSYCL